jgi:2-polyprenyl-6-methoxyphenol hydroxylase-like FAD-dependent oxidoreductase
MTRAVVLGGGFAGVLAAVVLARHVDEVVLVERGRYPATPGARPGLPQGHHSHVLVAGGVQALDALLPGTAGTLLARGAHRRGLTGGALIRSADGWFRRHETGAYLISCSRWLIDHVVRQRALAGGAVTVLEGTQALGLAGDASRIIGAVVGRPDGRVATIRADVVVDATGHRSRAARWLADLGAAPVHEVTAGPAVAYSTRLYRAPAGLAETIPAVMVHPHQAGHGATLFPIEGGRWIVTLTGTRGGEPPASEDGFTAAAYGLSSPIVAELMAVAEPLGGVRPYRNATNRRRHFERGPRPGGFLVIGDALAAVTPVYSHGMSVAALSALELAGELERRGAEPPVFADIQLAVAAVAERSWRMAAHQRHPASGGGAQVRMNRAMLGSGALMTAIFRTQTLIRQDGVTGASVIQEATKDPEPTLSTEEAIAQYPELSAWWRSGGRHVAKVPA